MDMARVGGGKTDRRGRLSPHRMPVPPAEIVVCPLETEGAMPRYSLDVMDENLEDLIYDWNVAGEKPARPSSRKVDFDDETLRDGLQSPSVTDPSIEEKIRILHYMHAIGIDNADIGLPGAGPHVQRTVERLAREIVDNKLTVYPSAAGR